MLLSNIKKEWKMGQILVTFLEYLNLPSKVEKISKDSLDSIPSPSPSVKIQIMGGKVGLRCKGKTLLGVVNKVFKTNLFYFTF
jgi:hypothetical protein